MKAQKSLLIIVLVLIIGIWIGILFHTSTPKVNDDCEVTVLKNGKIFTTLNGTNFIHNDINFVKFYLFQENSKEIHVYVIREEKPNKKLQIDMDLLQNAPILEWEKFLSQEGDYKIAQVYSEFQGE